MDAAAHHRRPSHQPPERNQSSCPHCQEGDRHPPPVVFFARYRFSPLVWFASKWWPWGERCVPSAATMATGGERWRRKPPPRRDHLQISNGLGRPLLRAKMALVAPSSELKSANPTGWPTRSFRSLEEMKPCTSRRYFLNGIVRAARTRGAAREDRGMDGGGGGSLLGAESTRRAARRARRTRHRTLQP